MIASDGTITLIEDILDLLKDTDPDDKLLIYDGIETDLHTVGDFIARVRVMDEPIRFPGWNVAIGYKVFGEPDNGMEVLISKPR